MAFYVNIDEATCRSLPYPEGIDTVVVDDNIENAILYGVSMDKEIIKVIDYNGFSRTIYNIDE
jgi:hypothetical protein